jgi:hypothetical protein
MGMRPYCHTGASDVIEDCPTTSTSASSSSS